MNLHAKTVSIIIATLLIGIAIGALGWSSIHNSRSEQLRQMRNQGGLYGAIDRYIDPVDSLQEERLRDLASAYQDTVGRFWRGYMYHRVDLMESFEEDILPMLDSTQAALLQPYLDRITTLPESARRDQSASDSTSVSDSTAVAASDSTSVPTE